MKKYIGSLLELCFLSPVRLDRGSEGAEWRGLHSLRSIDPNGFWKKSALLLWTAGCLFAAESNQLQKVFLHTLEVNGAKEAHIELAKLVFYFSHEPQIRSEQVAVQFK